VKVSGAPDVDMARVGSQETKIPRGVVGLGARLRGVLELCSPRPGRRSSCFSAIPSPTSQRATGAFSSTGCERPSGFSACPFAFPSARGRTPTRRKRGGGGRRRSARRGACAPPRPHGGGPAGPAIPAHESGFFNGLWRHFRPTDRQPRLRVILSENEISSLHLDCDFLDQRLQRIAGVRRGEERVSSAPCNDVRARFGTWYSGHRTRRLRDERDSGTRLDFKIWQQTGTPRTQRLRDGEFFLANAVGVLL